MGETRLGGDGNRQCHLLFMQIVDVVDATVGGGGGGGPDYPVHEHLVSSHIVSDPVIDVSPLFCL